jgi:DnaJ-class molecular chaperone
MKDYYKILELEKKASQEEISWAYSRLSLKHHPKKNNQKDIIYNNYIFSEIAEAYQALSNPENKSVYDYFGYDGLINGVTDNAGNLKGGCKFAGNSYEIFEKYFGTKNPYTLIKDSDTFNDEFGTMFGSSVGGLYYDFDSPPLDLNVDLLCSLEEVYIGGLKRINYKKIVTNHDSRTTCEKEYFKDVEISKGINNGEKIVFVGEGNQKPGYDNCNFLN